MVQPKQNGTSEGAKLRRLAMNPATELMFTQRSGNQAEEMGVSRPDCLRIIGSGRVIKSENHGNEWRRWVQGIDLDGNTVTLALTVVTTNSGTKRIVILDCERD